MPDPQKKPTTGEQVAAGYKKFKEVADNAAKTAPKKEGPPDIDTGSVGGFLESAKNRLKYAVFGPDEKK